MAEPSDHRAVMKGDVLAVSREPVTGSPLAGPSGTVLAAAKVRHP